MSFKKVKLNYVYFIKQLIFTIKQNRKRTAWENCNEKLELYICKELFTLSPGVHNCNCNCTTHFKPLMESYFNSYLFFQEKFYFFRVNLQFYI